MALKTYKPTTKTRRHTILVDRKDVSKKAPEKSLLRTVKRSAGRNNTGKVTVRHQQGGSKRKYRVIDFLRDKHGIPATVAAIEYDPNRSANIALLNYADGEKRYIIAPKDLKVGDKVVSGDKDVEIRVGNCTLLKNIPSGLMIHNVEVTKGKGAALCRGAGTSAQIQGGANGLIQLKMPSGEIRLVHDDCYAVVGEVGNADYSGQKLGKAGRRRGMGWRPSVRGMAMHAEQHPHGGGEGKGQVGGPAKDIWGHRRGLKTRKTERTNKFILKRKTSKQRPFVKKLS